MAFTFQTVPNNVVVPGVYSQESVTTSNLTPINDECLLVAQINTNSSTNPNGIAADNSIVQVNDISDVILYCGLGTPAHLAATAAYTANPNVDLSILCVADKTTNSYATSTMTSVSAPGAFNVNIFIDDVTIPVSVPSTGISAISIVNIINSYAGQIPCTAVASEGVTLTSVCAGTQSNNIRISTDSTYITFSAFSGGSGSYASGFSNYLTPNTYAATLAASSHTIIINALDDTSTPAYIETILAFRSGPVEQRPAVQVVAYTDKEFSSTSAVLAAALALDDARTTLAYISYATGTGYPKNSSIKLSGAYGATIPLSSNTNVNVPYDDLVLTSVVPPKINDRFFNNICQTLLQGGVTPLIVVPGEQVAICRAVSTYTVNAQDLPDPTLNDINTIRTIDYVTEEIVDNLSNNFQRVQLSPRILKSIVSNVAQTTYTLEANGILQNTTLYSANITAVPDTGTIGRVDVTVPVNVVVGLHVIAVNIQVNI